MEVILQDMTSPSRGYNVIRWGHCKGMQRQKRNDRNMAIAMRRCLILKTSGNQALKIEIEKLKNEKESNQIKINKFENASKSLDKLKGSQISDNSRKDTSNEVKTTLDTPLVEELVSEKEKQTIFPKQQDKTDRKPVKYEEMYRSQKPRGNQRNWNNLKSQTVRELDFSVMYNIAVLLWGDSTNDNQGYVDSGCSRHMNKQPFLSLQISRSLMEGFVTLEGGSQRRKNPASKDETSGILKNFITEIESLVEKKNRVIIVKPHNKTSYELFRGRTPALSFMRPFCELMLLEYKTCRPGKFEENLHIRFLEDKPIVSGDGRKCLFDIDSLTKSMDYVPVIAVWSLILCYAGVSKKRSGVDDQKSPKSSTTNINTVGPSINTASANLRTGSLHINTVSPTVLTTRIHKDNSLYHGIGDIETGEEPKRVTKDLNDSAWVEAMQEELLQFKLQKISSIGELTFFLGLQVKQKEDGIFISQDKYVTDILTKFSFQEIRTASTPMDTEKPLLKDSDGDDVDVHLYRSMIGSLMYLTSSRPDIMFVVCACARFQVTPKVSHSHVVKRIFRYRKGKPKLVVDIRVAEALGHSLLMLRIVLGLEYEHCGYELICWNRFNLKKNLLNMISSISIRSSNALTSESPYLSVLLIGTSQSRQHDKSESVSYYLTDQG
ncbi:hypothetical protein Tco_1006898 [Tanacetum coccineum]|uniref:Reverse transcriptase Ty1/copia-type domain-containing protein n=1 Tax=Tanacetum coccineum TaxID=301880 RepID=A0ABQ5FJ26_9ASTR